MDIVQRVGQAWVGEYGVASPVGEIERCGCREGSPSAASEWPLLPQVCSAQPRAWLPTEHLVDLERSVQRVAVCREARWAEVLGQHEMAWLTAGNGHCLPLLRVRSLAPTEAHAVENGFAVRRHGNRECVVQRGSVIHREGMLGCLGRELPYLQGRAMQRSVCDGPLQNREA